MESTGDGFQFRRLSSNVAPPSRRSRPQKGAEAELVLRKHTKQRTELPATQTRVGTAPVQSLTSGCEKTNERAATAAAVEETKNLQYKKEKQKNLTRQENRDKIVGEFLEDTSGSVGYQHLAEQLDCFMIRRRAGSGLAQVRRNLRCSENVPNPQSTPVAASVVEIRVAQRRKTIKMDESIDISTESVVSGDASIGEEEQERDRNKGGAEHCVQTAECIELVDKSSSKTLLMEYPSVPLEKIRSSEIHRYVKEANVNRLIEECIRFLKYDGEYAKEILRWCRSNYFSDIDYRSEIERVGSRKAVVEREIERWGNIYERKCSACRVYKQIVARSTLSDTAAASEMHFVSTENSPASLYSQALERVKDEFEEKAQRLVSLEIRVRNFLEAAKRRSDELLTSIFSAAEKRDIDALFLLRAMSRLGQNQKENLIA